MNYIQGEKFIGLANGIDIFYCHTHDVGVLLKEKQESTPYVLITHNSDESVNFTPPDNVISWYAQNVNIIHPRIESIPLGLENSQWFPETHKKDKMTMKLTQQREFKNLVYLNHNIDTSPGKRLKPYQLLEGKPWVTMERRSNGQDFDSYLNNIYNHKFVICPEGHGIDTHRTWETLYMGSIPIEKRNINNQFYTDLPICFVDDWEEVTEEYLDRWFAGSSWQTWNMEKLDFEYWKKKIISTQ